MLRAPAYSWSVKSIRLLALYPTLTWGTTKDGQGCHHLPPTPTDHGEGMQTTVISSPDTTSALSITTLASTPSTTRAFRLEQPSRGRTMIPQAKDNKGLTQIRTQQIDELRYLLERGSYPPRYKQRETDNSGTPPELLLAYSLAYSLQDSSKMDSPLLLLLSKVCC